MLRPLSSARIAYAAAAPPIATNRGIYVLRSENLLKRNSETRNVVTTSSDAV